MFLTIAALGVTLPARAGITYTCDASFNAFAPVGTCDAMNGSSIAGVYSSILSNATAKIYVDFSGSGLAGSNAALNSVSYTDYLTALAGHEAGVNDVTAVNSLAGTEPSLYGDRDLAITSALATALGFSASAGMDATGASCNLSDSGCYNGIITFGASANPIYFPLSPGDPTSAGWDFFMLAEHETDEILGTISCIGTDPNNTALAADQCVDSNLNTYLAAADLFRYSAPATLSFLNNTSGGPAYFSIDGGATNVASYLNSPNAGDFGDWAAGCSPARVQNASACQSTNADISNDGGAEIFVLDAIGFNLNSQTTPEPGTWSLIGASLAVLAFACRRRLAAGRTWNGGRNRLS